MQFSSIHKANQTDFGEIQEEEDIVMVTGPS